MVLQNSLVTNFLQNIFLCVQQNKFIQVWNYLRVSKLWQNFHFWVNYHFKVKIILSKIISKIIFIDTQMYAFPQTDNVVPVQNRTPSSLGSCSQMEGM